MHFFYDGYILIVHNERCHKLIEDFEHWCSEKWYEHTQEKKDWERLSVLPYTQEQYIEKNSVFLRKLYEDEVNRDDSKNTEL